MTVFSGPGVVAVPPGLAPEHAECQVQSYTSISTQSSRVPTIWAGF